MKRLLSLMLAGALVAGLTTAAFAAPGGKITGVRQAISQKDFSGLEVSPGRIFDLPLTADMFDWEEGVGAANEAVTESQLSSGKIDIKVSYANNKSKDVIDSIKIASKTISGIDKKTAYIKVEFKEDHTGLEEKKFEFTIYLTHRSNRIKESAITFEGVVKKDTLYLESDEDSVDISGGEVVEPESYMRSVEVYIGAGITITTKMFKDKKYYGVAEELVTEEDSKILDAYPEIETVYTLKTVNLDSGKVYFDVEDTYHVYDEKGKYLGTTDKDLKYSNKYYLSEEKINISSKNSSSDDDDYDDYAEDNTSSRYSPVDETDEYIPPVDYSDYSSTDNPSTGAGGALRIISAVGFAVLAVAIGAKRRW